MQLPNKCFINGKWLLSETGNTKPVYNPATDEVLDYIPHCSPKEIKFAIDAADQAFAKWKYTTGKERGKILYRIYELMMSHREDLAKVMVMEQGKTIHDARAEIDYSAAFFEWFSEEAKRIYGDIVPSIKRGQHLFTIKEPVGVVAAITPWNFPSSMIARKIAPALAAGCSIIAKPASDTPFSALLIAQLAQEAGLPDGVLNIIFGNSQEIGDLLTVDNAVKMLTFTGSTEVGKTLMEKCSNTVKKVTLELGGNAPFIVFDDADLMEAATGALISKLRNGGQTCICPNRFFVHSSILDEFSHLIKTELQKIKVGNGLNESNGLGPLINQHAVTKINKMIRDAESKGAEILYRAKIDQSRGSFYAPTIIKNHTDQSLLMQDEIFGPVFSLIAFDTEEEVLNKANSTPYGLASYFYTQDISRAWRVKSELEYGMVAINDVGISSEVASFGGVKESGIGREGGKSGILEYLEDKFIVMKI